MAIRRAAIVLLTAVAASSAWGATERPLLGGHKARFRTSPLKARAAIAFRGDAALASFGDPRCPARSSLRLSTAVGRFTEIELRCANWRSAGKGYLYKDPLGAAGGVRRILLRTDRLTIAMSGANYAPVNAPLAFAEVTFAVGGDRACGRFAQFKVNAAGRAVAARGSQACRPRPNFLIVNLDDTRADGIDRMPTVLSRLAGEGIAFSNSFAVLPLCAPSRASMLSGLYARRHGVRALGGEVGGAHVFREDAADQQTIAVWLRAAGYDTGLFGKYINGYGASESQLGPGATFYVPPGWSRWRGMMSTEHYGGVNGPTYVLVDEQGATTPYDNHANDEQYSTDLLAGEARGFIADAVSGGRNFFAYYAPYASHVDTPNFEPHPAERHRGTFLFQLPFWEPPNWNEADVSDKPLWVQTVPEPNPITAALNEQTRDLAYETLLAVDEQLGLFLDQFDALGIADDTVVMFTSDNGVAWGEHRLLNQWKQCAFEECLRVPMIVRYPRFADQATQDAPVLNVDVAPTVASLAGVTPPVAVDGASFAGWIVGAPPPPRADFLIENWRGRYGDHLTYTGQPADGDRIRVLYGPARPQPRPELDLEFDADGQTAPGAIAVPIGASADAAFGNLGDAIVAAVPFTGEALNAALKTLTISDFTPDRTGIYFMVDRDVGGVIDHRYPLPDYFGVRDVANGFTYVEYENGEVELYDLTSDPYELENVASVPGFAGVRAALAGRLQSLLDTP